MEKPKRVLILGMDGYLGWSLTTYLLDQGGYVVSGVDNYSRREWVQEIGSYSAIPIQRMNDRLLAAKRVFRKDIRFWRGDLRYPNMIENVLRTVKPDAIVHFAEMPSAPYSMIDSQKAIYTHINNLAGTIALLYAIKSFTPNAHLVKLGTMGEYGTPNVPIPEGFIEIERGGRKDVLPFPKQPGSWYHLTKVHDTNNIMFACRIWGLKSTDIMQGVVYGTSLEAMREDPELLTRFDFDSNFGTAINRFVAQALIGYPITPYGKGKQRRGFLPLQDSMQCLKLAIDNPPEPGEYRVFNQFEETYEINELADIVAEVAEDDFDLNPKVQRVENPRKELEEHFYASEHQKLLDLGYEPFNDMRYILRGMFRDLFPFKKRIEEKKDILNPDVLWSGEKRRVRFI